MPDPQSPDSSQKPYTGTVTVTDGAGKAYKIGYYGRPPSNDEIGQAMAKLLAGGSDEDIQSREAAEATVGQVQSLARGSAIGASPLSPVTSALKVSRPTPNLRSVLPPITPATPNYPAQNQAMLDRAIDIAEHGPGVPPEPIKHYSSEAQNPAARPETNPFAIDVSQQGSYAASTLPDAIAGYGAPGGGDAASRIAQIYASDDPGRIGGDEGLTITDSATRALLRQQGVPQAEIERQMDERRASAKVASASQQRTMRQLAGDSGPLAAGMAAGTVAGELIPNPWAKAFAMAASAAGASWLARTAQGNAEQNLAPDFYNQALIDQQGHPVESTIQGMVENLAFGTPGMPRNAADVKNLVRLVSANVGVQAAKDHLEKGHIDAADLWQTALTTALTGGRETPLSRGLTGAVRGAIHEPIASTPYGEAVQRIDEASSNLQDNINRTVAQKAGDVVFGDPRGTGAFRVTYDVNGRPIIVRQGPNVRVMQPIDYSPAEEVQSPVNGNGQGQGAGPETPQGQPAAETPYARPEATQTPAEASSAVPVARNGQAQQVPPARALPSMSPSAAQPQNSNQNSNQNSDSINGNAAPASGVSQSVQDDKAFNPKGLTLYHGTNAAGAIHAEGFRLPDPNGDEGESGSPYLGDSAIPGVYLADDQKPFEEGGHLEGAEDVLPVHVDATRLAPSTAPGYADLFQKYGIPISAMDGGARLTAALQADGYEGIRSEPGKGQPSETIVFDPKQVHVGEAAPAPAPASPKPEFVGSVNLGRVNAPEEVKQTIRDAAHDAGLDNEATRSAAAEQRTQEFIKAEAAKIHIAPGQLEKLAPGERPTQHIQEAWDHRVRQELINAGQAVKAAEAAYRANRTPANLKAVTQANKYVATVLAHDDALGAKAGSTLGSRRMLSDAVLNPAAGVTADEVTGSGLGARAAKNPPSKRARRPGPDSPEYGKDREYAPEDRHKLLASLRGMVKDPSSLPPADEESDYAGVKRTTPIPEGITPRGEDASRSLKDSDYETDYTGAKHRRAPLTPHPLESAAVKNIGTTSDAYNAGYILSDGRMLDLSAEGKGGGRSEDHRIVAGLPGMGGRQGYDAIHHFMAKTGAIRMSEAGSGPGEPHGSYTFHAKRPLTRAQENRIVEITRSRAGRDPKVYIDIDDPEHMKVAEVVGHGSEGRSLTQQAQAHLIREAKKPLLDVARPKTVEVPASPEPVKQSGDPLNARLEQIDAQLKEIRGHAPRNAEEHQAHLAQIAALQGEQDRIIAQIISGVAPESDYAGVNRTTPIPPGIRVEGRGGSGSDSGSSVPGMRDVAITPEMRARVEAGNRRPSHLLAGEHSGPIIPSLGRRAGLDLPESDRDVSLDRIVYGDHLPEGAGKWNVNQIADHFTAQAEKAWGKNGLRDLSDPANRKRLVNLLVHESELALSKDTNAIGWYGDKLAAAHAAVSLIHPEIAHDEDALFAFDAGLAITSNGQSVPDNAAWALKVYEHYKAAVAAGSKRPMPENMDFPGTTANAMRAAFKLFNNIYARIGVSGLRQFCNTEFTVSELKALGFNVSGELTSTRVPGSVIFGPKIGGGFLRNLQGHYDALTMDRWFMRTWGRLTGTMYDSTPERDAKQRLRLRTAIKTISPRLLSSFGDFKRVPLRKDNDVLAAFAKQVYTRYANGGFKEKTELNKAAKELHLSTDPILAPRSGVERANIRAVAKEATDRLKERGIPIDMSDWQALIWYPEKELYKKLGSGNAKSEPTDYEQSFRKLALARGHSESDIDRVVSSVRHGGRSAGAGISGVADQSHGQSTSILSPEYSSRGYPSPKDIPGDTAKGLRDSNAAAAATEPSAETDLAGVERRTPLPPGIRAESISREGRPTQDALPASGTMAGWRGNAKDGDSSLLAGAEPGIAAHPAFKRTLAQLGAFHVEQGLTKYPEWSAQMRKDLEADGMNHLVSDGALQTAFLAGKAIIAENVVSKGGVRPSSTVFAEQIAKKLGSAEAAHQFVEALNDMGGGESGTDLLDKVIRQDTPGEPPLTPEEEKMVARAWQDALPAHRKTPGKTSTAPASVRSVADAVREAKGLARKAKAAGAGTGEPATAPAGGQPKPAAPKAALTPEEAFLRGMAMRLGGKDRATAFRDSLPAPLVAKLIHSSSELTESENQTVARAFLAHRKPVQPGQAAVPTSVQSVMGAVNAVRREAARQAAQSAKATREAGKSPLDRYVDGVARSMGRSRADAFRKAIQNADGSEPLLQKLVDAPDSLTEAEQDRIGRAWVAHERTPAPKAVADESKKALQTAVKQTRAMIEAERRASLSPKENVRQMLLRTVPEKDHHALATALAGVRDDDATALAEILGRFARRSLSYYVKGVVVDGLLSGLGTFGKIGLSHALSVVADNASRPAQRLSSRYFTGGATRGIPGSGGKSPMVQNLNVKDDLSALSVMFRKGGKEALQILKSGEPAHQLAGGHSHGNMLTPDLGKNPKDIQGEFTPFPHSNPRVQAALNYVFRTSMRNHGAFYHMLNTGLSERYMLEIADIIANEEADKWKFVNETRKLAGQARKDYVAKRKAELMAKPTLLMHEFVRQELEEAMFTNPNAMASLVPGAIAGFRKAAQANQKRNALPDATPIAESVAALHQPFGTVPANVIGRGIENKVGAAAGPLIALGHRLMGRELNPEQRRSLDKMFGRGVFSAAMMAAGYLLAHNALVNAPDAETREHGSANIAGQKKDIGGIEPASSDILMGAKAEAMRKKVASGQPLTASDWSSLAMIPVENSPFIKTQEGLTSGIDILKDPSKAKPSEVKRTVGGLAGSLMPKSTILGNIAAEFDPAHAVRQQNSILDVLKNKIPLDTIGGVPVGRYSLPIAKAPDGSNIPEPRGLFSPTPSVPITGPPSPLMQKIGKYRELGARERAFHDKVRTRTATSADAAQYEADKREMRALMHDHEFAAYMRKHVTENRQFIRSLR